MKKIMLIRNGHFIIDRGIRKFILIFYRIFLDRTHIESNEFAAKSLFSVSTGVKCDRIVDLIRYETLFAIETAYIPVYACMYVCMYVCVCL